MPAVCPVCQKDDMIQKISAIRKSGTTTGHYSGPSGGVAYVGGKLGGVGGYTTLSGTSATRLAQLLPPPRRPTKPRPKAPLGTLILIVGLILTGLLLCSASGNQSAVNLSVFVGIGVVVAGSVVVRIETAAAAPAIEEAYTAAMNEWSDRTATYERIYYCHRDDISFDPETGQYMPLPETWRLIFKEA